MIKLENTDVFGWEAAIRGMRNPMNSWSKSDTTWKEYNVLNHEFDFYQHELDPDGCDICLQVGPNDLRLMKQLRRAGHDHAKYLRMINVTVDITAPLYWWKEFDTYKVGTVRNSCSTMHKIQAKEFTLDDFSCEHLTKHFIPGLECTIIDLNYARKKFLETKEKTFWWQMIQLLPSSYNQRATVQLNYEVLNNMYRSRKNHKLDEWHTFCDWIETLPYAKELIVGDEE